MNTYRLWMLLSLLALLAGCAEAPKKPQTDFGPRVKLIDRASYEREVLDHPGPVTVLFFNQEYWQSKDMRRRFKWLAERYWRQVKFCELSWDPAWDARTYQLEKLPTTILYRQGQELDRIRGVPENREVRADWNQDLELWLIRNALPDRRTEFDARFNYRFNNTSELNSSNY